MGSRGTASRCSFVYLRPTLYSSVLFHVSIWLRTPHTPVGNPIWTHIYVTIRLFITAPPSISMSLTNPLVSSFNFMQLSQVPSKTISDKLVLHISADHQIVACCSPRRGVWLSEQREPRSPVAPEPEPVCPQYITDLKTSQPYGEIFLIFLNQIMKTSIFKELLFIPHEAP